MQKLLNIFITRCIRLNIFGEFLAVAMQHFKAIVVEIIHKLYLVSTTGKLDKYYSYFFYHSQPILLFYEKTNRKLLFEC
jgi:hypothetical protein